MGLIARYTLEQALKRLREEIERLFEGSDFAVGDLFGGGTPPANVLQDKNKVPVKAKLSGLRAEDIRTSHDNRLRPREQQRKRHDDGCCKHSYGEAHRFVPLRPRVNRKTEAKKAILSDRQSQRDGSQ